MEGSNRIGYEEQTQVVVVKRCIVSSLSRTLTATQRTHFLEYIDQSTELASRLARRTSLAFLYYVVRHQEMGARLPDFKRVTDGYWKAWMRIGLQEFGGEYPVVVVKAITRSDPELVQSQASIDATVDIFEELDHLLGTTLDAYNFAAPTSTPNDSDLLEINQEPSPQMLATAIGGQKQPPIPRHFDRILGHLAIQFKTAVRNSMVVNFLAKLKRLCRIKAAEHGIKGVTAITVLRAVCRNAASPGWPEELQVFVRDARSELGLTEQPDMVIYDDTAFPMPVRFAFHWWMQQQFVALGHRKLMLSPVFKVQRMHVRLDATHLCLILDDLKRGPRVVEELKNKRVTVDKPSCPTKSMFLEPCDFKEAKEQYKRIKAKYDAQMVIFKEDVDNLGPSCRLLQVEKPDDPEVDLDTKHPLPGTKRPPNTSDECWKVLKTELQKARDDVQAVRCALREQQSFKEAVTKYASYESKVHAFALGIFTDFKDRNPKLGWKPSASVCTDGVSISIVYERTVMVPIKTCSSEEEDFKKQKADKRKKAKAVKELAPCDDYEPSANTCVGDALVLGIDPGRTFIVTVVCIDHLGRKHTWRLSRGQYHTESGILEQNRQKTKRYSKLQESFQTLTADGGALRASSSAEIRAYVKAYQVFEKTWWQDVALKRRESRANFQRFVGKQKTLSSFFSRLRKEADALKGPDQTRIEVAYGAVGPTIWLQPDGCFWEGRAGCTNQGCVLSLCQGVCRGKALRQHFRERCQLGG